MHGPVFKMVDPLDLWKTYEMEVQICREAHLPSAYMCIRVKGVVVTE